jgi:hypothetical protein
MFGSGLRIDVYLILVAAQVFKKPFLRRVLK